MVNKNIRYGIYIFFLLNVSHCDFTNGDSISDYKSERDRSYIINAFERDREWLTYSPSTKIEYYLDRRTPDYDPLHFGRLKTKVLYAQSSFAGFVSYWMDTEKSGVIKFLDVEPAFRGKKFGERLIRYAVQDLCALGAQEITLLTRPDNFSAQKVYEAQRFKEVKRDKRFVYYTYTCKIEN